MFQSSSSCFITLCKKSGYSSASSLNKLKSILKVKKAGFCGTLDPIAEGVIVVAINKATKLIRLVTSLDKCYSGKLKLGYTSPSYDTETELKNSGVKVDISTLDIPLLEKTFKGEIEQEPPSYSALKVSGKRAYQLARKGLNPTLPSRKVTINSLKLSVASCDELIFKVSCSKGTYIRSLVNDIGLKTGYGAVLTELVREKVGDFNIEDSVSIDDLKKDPALLEKKGMTVIDVFLSRFNKLEIDRTQYNYLRNGNDISESGLEFPEGFSYLKYSGSPAFLIENRGGVYRYFAFLRDEND